MASFQFDPIGIIESHYVEPYTAPRQPRVDNRLHEAKILLNKHCNYEQALEDVIGFERIWVVAVFDRVESWKPKILTPRDRVKRGVFATRSPHRPNPISLSCVEVVDVQGLKISVRGIDMLNGTPVLDIKPYLPYADSFEGSRAGWTDNLEPSSFEIQFDCDVASMPEDLRDHVVRILSSDPLPHPYRRISEIGKGRYEIAIQHWRCEYTICGTVVSVDRVTLLP